MIQFPPDNNPERSAGWVVSLIYFFEFGGSKDGKNGVFPYMARKTNWLAWLTIYTKHNLNWWIKSLRFY